ncbi:TonB-dependent receptor [Rhizorhabdus wittichii RW1]|uniref:TonB-dependent receptor n=1 Tax=Rhizorhabdus wittichii (strain DSM 6014 / CCUG 31198 / JCM 15750 / NBRC 105917 / EY 4224 / RW1) TaxID=392499 RepID=A0A9J9HFP5_RHIWR|nr:TonB-dependent receptor [Rhizorhabdus wittichii RW1]
MTSIRAFLHASALSASLLVAAGAVQAQQAAPAAAADDAGTTGLQDIIVTAERRSSSAQRTPVAVTALSADTLVAAQVRTLTDMQQLVPAFKMGENDGYAQLTIRGIGSSGFVPTAEGAVAVNLNDVYVSRPIAQLAGMYDIASVEVLKGPQGTLYGRNATAGSVNMSTARPTNEWSGFGRVLVGNYRALNVEGAVGGALVEDRLLVRVAGFMDKHDGYGKNLVTGNDVSDKDAWGVRATVVVKPTDTLTGTLIYEHYKQSDNGAALHYFGAAGLTGLPGALGTPPVFQQLGGYAASDVQDIASPRDSRFRLRIDAVTGILEWSLGDFQLKSITGYRDQNSLTITPLGGGSSVDAFFIAGEPAHQFSQEVQLNYTSDRLKATAGLFYFREKDSSVPGSSPFPRSVLNAFFGVPDDGTPDYLVDFVEIGGTIKTRAKAAFAQATYEVVDNLSLTAGIRVSNERKQAFLVNGFSLTQPYIANSPTTNDTPLPPVTVQPRVSFNSTTPRLGIQYQVDPRTMVYASYSKGFKSGGYDVTTVAPAFEPEKLTAYEVGIKTTMANNRLRFNAAGFYYDYTNLQVLQVVGPAVVTTNAATARVYGVEAQIDAIVSDQFKLEASGSYLNTKYKNYAGPDGARPLLATVDFSGNHLNNAPEFQAYLAGTYTWALGDGEIAARVDGEYSTRYYFTPANLKLLSQKPFAKVNASLTYKAANNWQVTAFVKNITDIDTKTSGVVNTPILGTPAQGAVAPPRTFGLEARYSF